MNFKDLIKLSTPAVIYDAIKSYYRFKSQKRNIGPRLYSKAMNIFLSRTLNVSSIKKDRAGRLYCIINPTLNDRGQFDTNMIIYELDSMGLNYSNNRFIEEWIARKLKIIQDLFKQRDLFGQLEFSVTHVGPVNHDNYLFVIQPNTFDDWQINKKRFWKRIAILCGIALVGFGIWKLIF